MASYSNNSITPPVAGIGPLLEAHGKQVSVLVLFVAIALVVARPWAVNKESAAKPVAQPVSSSLQAKSKADPDREACYSLPRDLSGKVK